MLELLQRQGPALSWKTGNDTMEGNGSDPHQDKARRFRDAALPCLDDVYTLARYLLRDAGDAEDAVQECYLRALKHFDSYRGDAIKPCPFAILRNVCYAEFARRAGSPTAAIEDVAEDAGQAPLWSEAPETPEAHVLRRRDAGAIRRLVDAVAGPVPRPPATRWARRGWRNRTNRNDL